MSNVDNKINLNGHSGDLLDTNNPDNDKIARQINDLKLYVGGEMNVSVNQSVASVPRFGLLSLKVRNTPIYAYDHPALVAKTNTAFTDGVHIFISADFLRQLNKEEDESNGSEYGAEPLVLHELMHMLKNHVRRLTQYPPDIRNKATDLSINAQLQLGFNMKWVKTLREMGLSFKEGEAEEYATLAESTIARKLMEDRHKEKQNEQNQQQQGQKGQFQSGQGQKGQSQSGQGQKGQSQSGQGQKGQGGQSDGSDGGSEDWSDQHVIPLEELIDTLKENGLDHILDALNLPHDSGDIEEIGKKEEMVRLQDIDAIQKAAARKAQVGGAYPGGHIVDSCAEMVKGFAEGKLSWKLGLKNFMFGEGMRFRYTEADPGDIYYIDPKDMGLNQEIFVGAEVPHKPEEIILALIDTSGSVSQEMFRSFFSEIFNLKRENAGCGDTASEIVVMCVDTTARGKAIEINENNVDELMKSGLQVHGRGGTDLANDLREVQKLPMFKDKKFSSVIFFTDLCDTPPKQSDFPAKLPLCFITTPHYRCDEFAKAVKNFARVYVIEEGTTVDLTEDHLATPVIQGKKKGR